MVRVPGASLLIALVIVGCAGLPAGSKAPSPSSPGSPDPSLAASPWHSSVPSTVPTATPSAPPPIILQPLISPMSDPDFEVIVAARDGFVVLGRDGDRGVIARGDPGVGDWQLFDGSSAFGDGGSRIAISTKGWLAAGDRRPPGGSWSPDGSAWTAVRDLADLEAVVEVFAGEWGFAALGMTTDAQGTSVYPVWASRDGLAWQELQSVPGFRPQQVAILSDALVAIESSSLRSAVSVDGRTWSQPMSGPPVDDESGVSTARIAVVGDRLVGLSAGATGFAVFTGTVAPGGVAWYRVDGSEQFDGAMPTAMAGGPRGAVILGFDRTTLAPLVWLSTDGLTWTRSSPPRATFGGGVPTVVAVGSRAIVALGWDVSEYGEVRARAWSSTDGSTWVRDDSDALGRLPGPPSVGCPSTPPTDVAGLAAMLDENDDGREVWPFCFGDRDLSIEGYVQDCGGCGGLSDYLSSPTWLIDPLGYSAFWLGEIANPEACVDPDGCTRIGAWVDPTRPVEVPPAGTLVRVVGHFDDAASGTCRLIPSQGWMMPLPPAAETAATCRQHFVVTDIEVVVR